MSLIGDIAGPYALISVPFRAIDTIIPDVVVEEIHNDGMAITDHSVEIGAAVSDHAFMQPCEVEMRIGFSNSTGGDDYVTLVYSELRDLQRSREPFNVSTGKRQYKNMMIRNLTVVTTPETENAMMAICSLREVNIVGTQTVSAPASAQAQPQRTAPAEVSGMRSTVPYGPDVPFFAQ